MNFFLFSELLLIGAFHTVKTIIQDDQLNIKTTLKRIIPTIQNTLDERLFSALVFPSFPF